MCGDVIINLNISQVSEKAIGYMMSVGYSYSRIDKIEMDESTGIWRITVIVGIGDKRKILQIEDKTGTSCKTRPYYKNSPRI